MKLVSSFHTAYLKTILRNIVFRLASKVLRGENLVLTKKLVN